MCYNCMWPGSSKHKRMQIIQVDAIKPCAKVEQHPAVICHHRVLEEVDSENHPIGQDTGQSIDFGQQSLQWFFPPGIREGP